MWVSYVNNASFTWAVVLLWWAADSSDLRVHSRTSACQCLWLNCKPVPKGGASFPNIPDQLVKDRSEASWGKIGSTSFRKRYAVVGCRVWKLTCSHLGAVDKWKSSSLTISRSHHMMTAVTSPLWSVVTCQSLCRIYSSYNIVIIACSTSLSISETAPVRIYMENHV